MADQDYDLAAFPTVRLITSMVLGDVFMKRFVPRGDPHADGDSLSLDYCEEIGCAGCRDHQLRVSGILAIKDDPGFVRILRSRIYEELGKQLLDYPPLAEREEPEAPSMFVEVGDA